MAKLIKEALEDLAPFKKTALERLHSAVFGAGRAARSTDVVIFNGSGKTLKLVANGCVTGGWTNAMLPEYIIPAHSSIVYGAESFGFLKGATNCVLKYNSTDNEATVQVNTSNPFFGRNSACSQGTNLYTKTIKGRGYNNLVRFFVEDGYDTGSKRLENGLLRCH